MVDLHAQYSKLKLEINAAIQEVLETTQFIRGNAVNSFEENLSHYLGAQHVISCANGTDALQIALMALDLKAEDEVIVPAFSYAATLEVIALLGIKAVLVDVEVDSFNLDPLKLEARITPRTKAIIPVHLFGQQANMQDIKEIADKHMLYIIEDNAQALGSTSTLTGSRNGVGHIKTTSFFPSKNLGCYGDGGAIYTDDKNLANKIRSIANHGQSAKYIHDIIGVNSRLDTIQAAVLNVKLPHLNQFIDARKNCADNYDTSLANISEITIPTRNSGSDHCFHQYTLKVKNQKREKLTEFLKSKKIPYSIYYPLPLHQQKAYVELIKDHTGLSVSEALCDQVLSLPMHPDLSSDQIQYICSQIHLFFSK